MGHSALMVVRKAQVLLLLAALSFTFIIGIACSGGDDEPSGDATNTPIATGTAAVATATSQARATATSVGPRHTYAGSDDNLIHRSRHAGSDSNTSSAERHRASR